MPKPNKRAALHAPEPWCIEDQTAPRLIGYVRVSTHEQNTNLQYDALRKLGCDPIFEDKITGVALERFPDWLNR